MKLKSVVCAVISVGAAATFMFGLSSSADAAASWTYIGGNNELNADKAYWVNGASSAEGTLGEDGCIAYFDAATGTLHLAGTGTISGVTNTKNGTALFESVGDMTIELQEGADITIAGADSVTANGIYINGYSLTIKGNGTLRVSSGTASKGKSAAIWAKGLTVDGATLIAEAGSGVTGSYAIMTEGNPVTLKNGASVTATGVFSAFDTAPQFEGYTPDITAYGGADGNTVVDYNEADSTKYKKIVITGDPSTIPEDIPTGVYIGGTELGKRGVLTYEKEGITAVYDKDNAELTISGTGAINGTDTSLTIDDRQINTYGAGIYSENTIDIILDEADVAVSSSPNKTLSYNYGIYVNNGDLTIKGSGKLTASVSDATTINTSSASAICTYKGNIIIDGVYVKASGGENAGSGLDPYGRNVTLINGASVEADGISCAVNATSVNVYEGASYKACSDRAGKIINVYDPSNPQIYKSLGIRPNYNTAQTEIVGAFAADEGAENQTPVTGFLTSVKGTGSSIETIYWNVTSNEETRALIPSNQTTITLENGEARIGLIVEGLYDQNATAEAEIY